MDIRQHVELRLKTIGWSRYALAQALKGKVPPSTIYGFLQGRNSLNSDHLGRVFDALGLQLTAETVEGDAKARVRRIIDDLLKLYVELPPTRWFGTAIHVLSIANVELDGIEPDDRIRADAEEVIRKADSSGTAT